VLANGTTFNPLRIRVKTDNAGTSASDEFMVPWVAGGTYQYDVWYNGAIIHTANGATNTDNTIVFSDGAGTKNIAITGTLQRWAFNNSADRLKLVTVANWGTIAFGNDNGAFYGCSNLNITATDIPTIGTNMFSFFRGCTSLVFNSSINNWNVGNVTNFTACFLDSSFNQSVNNWNVSSATVMSAMFGNSAYNASGYNQPLNNWNVSNVTNMNAMFENSPFNQDISTWNVSSVQIMSRMFIFSPFNQNIGSWNVGNVTNMNAMFLSATSFNQNIGGWNVGKVTDFGSMFSGATAFNQNLGGWDVISRTGRTTINMTSMLNSCGMNTANYDSTLVGWEAQAPVTGVTLGAAGRTYTTGGAGETARTSLISTYGWTITDAGGV
jgi:hypothetical protein